VGFEENASPDAALLSHVVEITARGGTNALDRREVHGKVRAKRQHGKGTEGPLGGGVPKLQTD